MSQAMREHIDRVLTATSAVEVWELHLDLVNEYGFDRVIYGLAYQADPNATPTPDDMVLWTNMPDAYREKFLTDGHYLIPPIMAWGEGTDAARPWAWGKADGTGRARALRDLVSFHQQFGVSAGYSLSFGETPPCWRAGMVLFARKSLERSEVEQVWQTHGPGIINMCRLAHRCLTALPHLSRQRRLTVRQREALQLVGVGRTTLEIAKAMKLRPVTVEKHLRLARQRLGAATSAEAVLKAAVQNQIYLPIR